MKKISFHLLLIALLAIGAAFVNKPAHASRTTLDRYSYYYKSADGSKVYYGFDITAQGWTKGIDYTCNANSNPCSFLADPTRAHSDLGGCFFYTWDVPSSGYDISGSFELLD